MAKKVKMRETYIKNQFSYSGVAVGFKSDQVLLPNKNKASREYLTHPGAVALIPFLDSPREVPLNRARVVMVQQYRYPVNKITIELPAGKLDGNENVQLCLKRELKEETGYSAKKFHKLMSYWPTPAFSDETIHLYWAEYLKKGQMSPDEDEFISVVVVPFGELIKKVLKGQIQDSKTMVALLSFAQSFKN